METVYSDKLFEFLTEIMETAKSQEKYEIAQRIDCARRQYMIILPDGKYFRLPLTSEFLGEGMAALQELLSNSPSLLSSEQIRIAKDYVESIKKQWFS